MALESFFAERGAQWVHMLADPGHWLALVAGGVAALLILVSAFVKTIMPLRWLAVVSNVGFVLYGAAYPAPMVALLHVALLPINLWRVLEMQRLTRRVRQAEASVEVHIWLRPYMRHRRMKAGELLFRRGDAADRLYALAEGKLELVETGRAIEAGHMFGEIAFFAPDRRRTASVRCVEPSTVLSIDEVSFRQLFFQNPGFGFEIVRLIAARLSADVRRLEGRVDAAADAPADPDGPLDLPAGLPGH